MSEMSSKAKKLFDEFNYSQTVYHAFLASGINNEYIEKKRKTRDAKRESFEEYVVGLEARIAELEAERRWIPVSERLPEVGKVVHVIDMNDIGSHLCNLFETAVLVEVSGNKRFGFIGHSGWDTSDVTHWMYAMPLPTPPEVQESEATSCKFCGSNKSDIRMNSIVCTRCGRKIGELAPSEVEE